MSPTRRPATPSDAARRPMALRRPVIRRMSAALAVAALAVSACGSSDDASDPGVEVQVDEAGDVADAEVAAPVDSQDAADEAAGVVEAEPAGMQEYGPIEVEGATLAPYGMDEDDPAVGTPAPVIRGESFDGTEVVVGGPSENPTMVVFLAHWCPHCNAEVPELIELDEAGLLPEGLDVVGVSTAVAADRDNYPPSQWIVENGWPWPTMADDETASAINAYGGTGFPFTVVLDADGNVLARRSGQATGDETVEFLEAALAGA